MTIRSTKTLFAAAIVLVAGADIAQAWGACQSQVCGLNGTQLSGIQLQGLKPVVSTMILPSGERIDLR